MTTNKELADAYRLIADNDFGAKHRAYLSDRADELDPPKPAWPDGMYAIVTFEQRFDERVLASYAWRFAGEWVTADGRRVCDDDDVTKVEPLRVLGDNEIAIPRIDVDYMGPHDTTAKFMREAANRARDLGHGSCVTEAVQAVLRAYADALDAEAGDAK